jgi:aminoglycoside 6'-N-acetyltransferase I
MAEDGEIIVRPMQAADKPAWGAMRVLLWPEEDAVELTDELDGLLGDTETLGVYGAFDGDELCGFVELALREYGDGLTDTPAAWVEGIFVLPDYRRRGVGQALVAEAENWARARGRTELGSDAIISNLTSLASHAAWGFEETERLVMFRKPLS